MVLEGRYSLLSEVVYNTIKEAIIKKDLEPGVKISETKLAKELGVSRTPVREALRTLSAEGFVNLSPNSSFVVNSFTIQDAFDILEVRRILENEAARLAAERITDRGRALLDKQLEIISELENEHEVFTAKRFTETDIGLHKQIYELCGNSRLERLGDMIQDRQVRLYVAEAINELSISHMFLKQHRELINAIKDGDAELAEKKSDEHIRYIIEQTKEYVSEEEEQKEVV